VYYGGSEQPLSNLEAPRLPDFVVLDHDHVPGTNVEQYIKRLLRTDETEGRILIEFAAFEHAAIMGDDFQLCICRTAAV
jgi:hypothetical protein